MSKTYKNNSEQTEKSNACSFLNEGLPADLKCQLLRFNSIAVSVFALNVTVKNSVKKNPHY